MAGDANGDTGSKDRKTVTLVAEMVAGVSKQVESLDRLTQSKFDDLQRQLDNVTNLPLIVNGLMERVRQHEDQIRDLEKNEEKRREYRIGALPMVLTGVASVVVTIVGLVVALHGG